jgi:uncharacterized protein YcfJ
MQQISRHLVPALVVLLVIPGVAPAQTIAVQTPVTNSAALTVPRTPILDSGKRQLKKLSLTARRNQGAPDPTAVGFTLGALIGGYAGMYVAARGCHCESDKGVLAGLFVGGAVGMWLARKLPRP